MLGSQCWVLGSGFRDLVLSATNTHTSGEGALGCRGGEGGGREGEGGGCPVSSQLQHMTGTACFKFSAGK